MKTTASWNVLGRDSKDICCRNSDRFDEEISRGRSPGVPGEIPQQWLRHAYAALRPSVTRSLMSEVRLLLPSRDGVAEIQHPSGQRRVRIGFSTARMIKSTFIIPLRVQARACSDEVSSDRSGFGRWRTRLRVGHLPGSLWSLDIPREFTHCTSKMSASARVRTHLAQRSHRRASRLETPNRVNRTRRRGVLSKDPV